MFKVLANFEVHKFDELAFLVSPTIHDNAHTTGMKRGMSEKSTKLQLEQRLLSLIVYLKHEDVISYRSSQWNDVRTTLYDDVIFIASSIYEAFAQDISWPDAVEQHRSSCQVASELLMV